MKYIPSIAFEEMSGSAKGVTAAKNRGRKYIRNKGTGVLWVIGASIICYRCSGPPGPKEQLTIVTQTDTIIIRDTISIPKLYPELTKVIDTIEVAVPVNNQVHDTVFIQLPREQKIYRSPEYSAWVSGYRPELDSLKIFREIPQIQTTTTITDQPRAKRFGIGIQVGYGIIIQQQPQFSPYIGVGVSYNIWNF